MGELESKKNRFPNISAIMRSVTRHVTFPSERKFHSDFTNDCDSRTSCEQSFVIKSILEGQQNSPVTCMKKYLDVAVFRMAIRRREH